MRLEQLSKDAFRPNSCSQLRKLQPGKPSKSGVLRGANFSRPRLEKLRPMASAAGACLQHLQIDTSFMKLAFAPFTKKPKVFDALSSAHCATLWQFHKSFTSIQFIHFNNFNGIRKAEVAWKQWRFCSIHRRFSCEAHPPSPMALRLISHHSSFQPTSITQLMTPAPWMGHSHRAPCRAMPSHVDDSC